MSSLKPLRSVAHNLAHQFASTLNYWSDDYAIVHLARTAVFAGVPVVVIDVLGQTIEPESLDVGVVRESASALKETLEELLKKEGMKGVVLTSAKLKFDFGANKLVPPRGCMPIYECICTLETAEGNRFEARLTERNS